MAVRTGQKIRKDITLLMLNDFGVKLFYSA